MTASRDVFIKSLREKLGHFGCCSPEDWTDVSNVAHAITSNHLDTVLVTGTRPPLTYSAYFEALFGQKLDGSKVRKRGK